MTKWQMIVSVIAYVLAMSAVMATCHGVRMMRESARKASCRPRTVLNSAKYFAEVHEGMYPALSATPGKFMFDGELLGDRYWSIRDHFCEFDRDGDVRKTGRDMNEPASIDDWSYIYLGYFIENEAQALAFVEAYSDVIARGGDFDGDLFVGEGRGNVGTDSLYRLRELEELPEAVRSMWKQAASLPVVIEWPGNHMPSGGNVVFMDGTEVYMDYPGEFPMTKPFIEGLQAIDAAHPPKPESNE